MMGNEVTLTLILTLNLTLTSLHYHEVPMMRHILLLLLLSLQGLGLSQKQKEICDHYTIIPQYGVGTASLNVAVAATIVFHHFAVWAQYDEWV